MDTPLTPDGKLACRSCAADWPMPARYLAHPTLNDGSKGEPWPVCNGHAPAAMCAGWFPLDEIKDQPSMTNKQAYAGLLERLVAERPTREVAAHGYVNSGQTTPINPDGPEAAEAISSLLTLLERALPHVRFSQANGGSGAAAVGNAIDAALNSDAPLSIGEGDRG